MSPPSEGFDSGLRLRYSQASSGPITAAAVSAAAYDSMTNGASSPHGVASSRQGTVFSDAPPDAADPVSSLPAPSRPAPPLPAPPNRKPVETAPVRPE